MYRWYQEAEVCHAYLDDVPDDVDPLIDAGAKLFAESEEGAGGGDGGGEGESEGGCEEAW